MEKNLKKRPRLGNCGGEAPAPSLRFIVKSKEAGYQQEKGVKGGDARLGKKKGGGRKKAIYVVEAKGVNKKKPWVLKRKGWRLRGGGTYI